MDMKLEVVVLPVSDVDRAKEFYKSMAFRLDADLAVEEGYRVVQLTPPGSSCSIIFGNGVTSAAPGSVQGLQLVVSDIEAARAELAGYGVDVSDVFHDATGVFHHAGTAKRVKLPAVPSISRHVVTTDELVRLADAMRPPYEPMVFVGAALGLRWGEVAGLRAGRIDFLNRTVRVVEQITRGPGGLHHVGPPKSEAGRRTLSVPSLLAIPADHLKRLGLSGADVDALVFPATDGQPLQYPNWRRRVWLPAVAAAGLGDLTFHDLRRANATAMVLDGLDLETAQTRLGHSDPRLTLAVDAQATTEADRVAADRLGERFSHARAMPARWTRDGATADASEASRRMPLTCGKGGRDAGI